jgi:hypothetical protein
MPAVKRLQTHALDRAATEIGSIIGLITIKLRVTTDCNSTLANKFQDGKDGNEKPGH